jgi:hypothetical protein
LIFIKTIIQLRNNTRIKWDKYARGTITFTLYRYHAR